MNSRDTLPGLEILARGSAGARHPAPLLFIHGAFTAAWCWDEHFLPYFAEAGYAAHALSLSGHGGSRGRDRLDTLSIADYVDDVREAVESLPSPPVLIGHSMGGFVVQKYLERHLAPAAILLCPVPPQGLMSAAFGVLFSRPGLLRELNAMMYGGKASPASLREALFAQEVPQEDLQRFHRLAQPESHRAIWDMTLFDLPHPRRVHDVPMLVLGAECDRLMPASSVRMTARRYGGEAEIFPGMGHGLMLERDWRVVAARMLAWLEEQKL